MGDLDPAGEVHGYVPPGSKTERKLPLEISLKVGFLRQSAPRQYVSIYSDSVLHTLENMLSSSRQYVSIYSL